MTKQLINLATILFPTFVVTLSMIPAVSLQTTEDPLKIQRNETEIGTPNATLNGSKEDGDTQNCQMPPCPPGEMCIQVCPESEPKQ